MPNRKAHQLFDARLRVEGIISSLSGANEVHSRLDRGVEKYGPDHQLLDYWHSEEGLREWLQGLERLPWQDSLTRCLRIGLGHIVMDEVSYENPGASEEELLLLALRRFKKQGYHRKHLKSGEG